MRCRKKLYDALSVRTYLRRAGLKFDLWDLPSGRVLVNIRDNPPETVFAAPERLQDQGYSLGFALDLLRAATSDTINMEERLRNGSYRMYPVDLSDQDIPLARQHDKPAIWRYRLFHPGDPYWPADWSNRTYYAPDITANNPLGPGDLVVLSDNRDKKWGSETSSWVTSAGKLKFTIASFPRRRLLGPGPLIEVSSEDWFQRVLQASTRKHGPFNRIFVISHCGGQTNDGPSIDFGEGRITSKNVKPATIRAIQRALKPDGAFVIATCGYYEDGRTTARDWLEGLKLWARKLNRKVYADQVTSHPHTDSLGSVLDPLKLPPDDDSPTGFAPKRDAESGIVWKMAAFAGLIVYRRASATPDGTVDDGRRFP